MLILIQINCNHLCYQTSLPYMYGHNAAYMTVKMIDVWSEKKIFSDSTIRKTDKVHDRRGLCVSTVLPILQQRPSRRHFWSGKSQFGRTPRHACPFDKNTARPTKFPRCSPSRLERVSTTTPLIIHPLQFLVVDSLELG